jgi:amino acid transporter
MAHVPKPEIQLFVRPASGIIRAWSLYDAWIYAFLSVNIVTLGFYIWTFCSFIPAGNPILATVLAMIFLTFQNIVYTALVTSMPRAGGDYVWQSRILGGFWGYFLSWPGWVFCLWLWAPIYGNMLCWLLFSPLAALMGNVELADWWSSPMGQFVSTIIVIIWVSIMVGLGMKWYARLQKWLFYAAIIGTILFVIPLLNVSPTTFSSKFDSFIARLLPNEEITYKGIIDTATREVGGFAHLYSFSYSTIGPSFALIPMLLFWIMWTVWGSPLFGEVRGAGDVRRVFIVFQAALIAAGLHAILQWILFDKAMGWTFYQSLNYLYYVGSGSRQWISSPTLLAAILMDNALLAIPMIILMSGWFWSWSGTLFLSSTRVIFATAFDRAFPKIFAEVKTRFNTPVNALLLMTIPSLVITFLYFFVPGFMTLTLDATFAIAIAYFGSGIACLLFPLRRPSLFNANPLARYKPVVIISSIIYIVFLLYIFWLWAVDPVYGVNNPYSAGFMIFLYILAAALYLSIKYYRKKKEGFDLSRVYEVIPVE